jgi:hypothetical protein
MMNTEPLDRWAEKYPELFGKHGDAMEELFELFILNISEEMVSELNEWIDDNLRVNPEDFEPT